MKKKGQLTNNDSALKNSEVCDFSGKSGKQRAASRKPRATSCGPFATLRLSRLNIGTSCEKKILCAFAPWREKFFTTKQPKLATCNLLLWRFIN